MAFRTRLEANLFPLDGRTVPELSQLWIRIGDYAIVGKTYSTFMDDAALPTTRDYNGPSRVTFARQWVARATVPLGSAGVLESSVEDAQSDFIAEGEFFAASGNARRPDAAARLRYAGEGATSSKPESRAGSPCALPGREVNRPGRLRHGRFRFRIARGVRAWRAPRP